MAVHYNGPYFGETWPNMAMAADDVRYLIRPEAPCTLVVDPAAGASVQVDISASGLPTIRSNPDGAIWVPFQTVNERTAIVLQAPVSAIRLTCSGGSAQAELAQ